MAFCDDLLLRSRAAGIPLNEKNAETLARFHQLLMEWNQRMDLTAVLEESEMMDRHYVDSLSPLQKNGLLLTGASIIDVGSGAGFPGIPLAVARPDLRVTLLDAQLKRVGFLKEAASRLGLANVRVIHGRAEDIARREDCREKFDVAAARALAPLPVLLEFLLPFVKVGGLALCWKGPAVLAEMPAGKKAAKLLGGILETPLPTPVPGRDWSHLLLPVRKIEKTFRQYPRKAGTPGRAPLGS